MNGGEIVSVSGSVKVMRSYDYCHFEICLSLGDRTVELSEIDNLRKDAQRLCDKAVDQYKTAKVAAQKRLNDECEAENIRREIKVIKENFPKSEWSEDQKAKVKALEDLDFSMNRYYNYEDE